MSDKVKISLCFEVEAEAVDVYVLKKALKEHPGAPMWLRHYLEFALEQMVRDARDGGAWKFQITGGEVNDA